MAIKTPEHDKVDAQWAQTIHEFIEWLRAHDYVICHRSDHHEFGGPPWPTKEDNETLIRKFFGVDERKFAKEEKALRRREQRLRKRRFEND